MTTHDVEDRIRRALAAVEALPPPAATPSRRSLRTARTWHQALAVAAVVVLVASGVGLLLAYGPGSGAAHPTTPATHPTVAPVPTTTAPTPAAPAVLSCSPRSDQVSSPATATAGSSTATVRWTGQGGPGTGNVVGATITVTEDGTTLLERPVTAPSPYDDFGVRPPYSGWEEVAPVCIEVQGSGSPTVFLTGYAGAMTCCNVVRAYSSQPGGSYVTTDLDVGRASATFETLGGSVVLVTANRDFYGKFDCEACSGAPVQIFEFVSGHFVEVTRNFNDQISADAQKWWSLYEQNPGDPFGLLAAWAADECAMGQGTQAFSTIDGLAATGKLGAQPSPAGAPPSAWPSGSAYVSTLRSFLHTEGYC